MVFHVCYVILRVCTEISRELLPFPIPVGILWYTVSMVRPAPVILTKLVYYIIVRHQDQGN